MAPLCPNLSNKKVKQAFDEMKEIFGEDMAYFLWSENGGYPLDLAPNGASSILFKSLIDHYGDRKQALIAKAKVYSSNFKDWFGDWTKKYETGASKVIDFNDAVDFLFEVNPELSKVGTKSEYEQYIKTIFPDSISNSIYWHGTDSDFSDGLNTAKRGKGSGAPETQNEMYFNRQPWASLQYISGVNRRIKDNEGFNNWVKLWWEHKEALGNGRMNTDDWKNEIIGPNTRQSSPNKHGVFDRDKGGTHGKYLSERKARYGYENKSDKEFFEEVFDIRYGKETFTDWINRKRDEFKSLWNNRSVKNGIIPVILNIHNPIVEEGQNTYYEEQRKLFTQAKRNGNDAILSNKSKNEFGSDVAVVFNPNKNVHFLGTKSDIANFKKWKSRNQVSKIVDENGEPLVVYHSTNKIFDTYKERDGIHFGSYNTALGVANEKFDPTFDTIEEAQASIAKGKFRIDQVFLNIRNPKQSKDLGTGWKQLITEGFDGGLYRAVEGDTSFVAFNPNQIKSATDNIGAFSNEDDNIYHNIQDKAEYYHDAREYADELEKKYLHINYLNLSKERKEALKRRVIEEFSKKFKHYRIIFYYPDNKSKRLKTYVKNYDERDLAEWGKVLFGESSTDDNYSDNYDSSEVAKMILREVRGTSIHEMLIGELIAKALKQYNITFAFSKTLGPDVAAKYEVVHGRRIIYVNTKAAFINTNNYKNRVTQTIMHEMLHAITEEAISRNDDLYKEIDKLRKQVIKELGNNAKDYGLTSVYEFMAELSNMEFVEKLKNIKTEKKITFFEWIRSIVNELARRILRFAAQNNGTAYSDAMEMLVKSAFPQEYKLPLTEPSEVVKRVYNQTTSNSTQNSYDENSYKSRIISQFSQLEKLYERMPNKSLSRQKIQDSIFEKINELRQKEEYEVVSETLKFAAAAIGSDEKIDSTLGYLYKQSKLSDPYSGITPTILIDMYRNSIKFYRNLLDNILPSALDKHLSDDDIVFIKN